MQAELVKRVHANPSEIYLLGLEHSDVVTLGRRAVLKDDLRVSPEDLEKLNFQYFYANRGGQATLHNKGQLVIYPIINLNHYSISVREFVCILEKSIQAVLKNLGIETHLKDGIPGVFTDKGKIAFVGLHVSRGVTSHGISINISNNLEDFSLIRSCGVDKESFDKLNNYGSFITSSIYDLFVPAFKSYAKLA